MKALLSLGFALLFVVSLTQADGQTPEVKEEELREEVAKKIAELGPDVTPEDFRIYMEELENVMDRDLPKDPQLRQSILKTIFEDLVRGQGQSQGQGLRRGFPDPFAPFEQVPAPR